MSKKKLLFLVNVDWFFASHRLPIAISALESGYDVHLACTFTDKAEYLKGLGIVLHEIPFSRSGRGIFKELYTLKQIYGMLRDIRPDVLHTVTIKPVLYGGMAAKLAGVPSMVAAVSGLGLIFVASDLKTKVTKAIVKVLYKFAFSHRNLRVIFQNDSDRQVLVNAIHLPPHKTIMIKGSGVDLKEYVCLPEPEGCCVVVMAARLLKEKGVYQFVDAARIFKNKKIPVQFLLVGDPDAGNPNSVSAQELEEWRDEGIVSILGFRSDIPEIFSRSNIVVLPSFYGEGLPKVLIEAAACGRAIITTDNPGCKEAVVDGVTGIVIPIKDGAKLAKAIEALVVDEPKRKMMGENARKFAEAEFNVRSVVDKHLEIYDELLGQSSV